MMRRLGVVMVGAALVPLSAQARKTAGARLAPSVSSVVQASGYLPAAYQSPRFAVGAVLLPDGRGGYDEVAQGCLSVAPESAAVPPSLLSERLSAGVWTGPTEGVGLRVVGRDAEAAVLPLGELERSPGCAEKLEVAAGYVDLDDAVLVYGVLTAVLEDPTCAGEGCGGQRVPLGFKAVPLTGPAEPLVVGSTLLGSVAAVSRDEVEITVFADDEATAEVVLERLRAAGYTHQHDILNGPNDDLNVKSSPVTNVWLAEVEGIAEGCLGVDLRPRSQVITGKQVFINLPDVAVSQCAEDDRPVAGVKPRRDQVEVVVFTDDARAGGVVLRHLATHGYTNPTNHINGGPNSDSNIKSSVYTDPWLPELKGLVDACTGRALTPMRQEFPGTTDTDLFINLPDLSLDACLDGSAAAPVFPAAQGSIRRGTRLRVEKVHPEDAYYGDDLAGIECTAGEDLTPNEDGTYGGQFNDCTDGTSHYFYKVWVALP